MIANITESAPDDDEPGVFHYHSESCDTSVFDTLANFRNNGGVSNDRYVALAKSIGEGVERYCSAIFDYDDLLLAPYADLTERAAPPDAYALHTPEQYADPSFPWYPFTPETPTAWTGGTSLVDGEDVLVPATMVFVPFHYLRIGRDVPIGQPISTGLACGCSPSESALSGLCEAIERDAFTIAWQARMSHPQIATDSLPAPALDLLERLANAGVEVKLLDITTDIRVPTVMSIALGSASTSPAVAVAAATDPSPARAVVKSIEEVAHTRRYARQLMAYTPELPVEVAEGHPHVAEQRDHLRFYCPQEAKRFIEFAWASTEIRRLSDMPDLSAGSAGRQLDALVAAVQAVDLDVVMCDLTTPDICQLGLYVTRIVVPGLHPLFMGHATRALGGRRLYSVPQLLGHPGIEPGGSDNPYPHPFP